MASRLHAVQPPLALCMHEDTASALQKIRNYDSKVQILYRRLDMVGAEQAPIAKEIRAYSFRTNVIRSVLTEKNMMINELRSWVQHLCMDGGVCPFFKTFVYDQFWLSMQTLNALSDNIPLMLEWQEKYDAANENNNRLFSMYSFQDHDYEVRVRQLVDEYVRVFKVLVESVYEEHGKLDNAQFMTKHDPTSPIIFEADPSVFDVLMQGAKAVKRARCVKRGCCGVVGGAK